MEFDKPPMCPKCKETMLDPNEIHNGLKTTPKIINGVRLLLVSCANCGAILGVMKK